MSEQNSAAVAGIGTKFYRWNSGSSQWAAISEILSISGPGMTRETIDVTSLDSTGGWREHIGSLRDGGNVTLSMNFTRAGYDLMKADFEDDDAQTYKVVLSDPDGTTLEFEGLVTEIPLNVEAGSQITADTTIKMSGKPEIYSDSSGA